MKIRHTNVFFIYKIDAQEELEKRISLLRESTKTSSDEVKRLSGTLNLKDVEVESLRADLASLSDQVPFSGTHDPG